MSEPNEQPPVFRKWSSWYLVVAVALVVQILMYSLFTRHFS